MSEENEVPSDEQVARSIIYKDDFFKQYSEIVPEVGERLERYVFDIRDALSALRASWEKEKGELQAQIEKGFSCPRCEFYQKESEGLKRVFDAEKQALEERVRELTERIKNYER